VLLNLQFSAKFNTGVTSRLAQPTQVSFCHVLMGPTHVGTGHNYALNRVMPLLMITSTDLRFGCLQKSLFWILRCIYCSLYTHFMDAMSCLFIWKILSLTLHLKRVDTSDLAEQNPWLILQLCLT